MTLIQCEFMMPVKIVLLALHVGLLIVNYWLAEFQNVTILGDVKSVEGSATTAKRSNRTLMWRYRPNFSPNLEAIHRTES